MTSQAARNPGKTAKCEAESGPGSAFSTRLGLSPSACGTPEPRAGDWPELSVVSVILELPPRLASRITFLLTFPSEPRFLSFGEESQEKTAPGNHFETDLQH